MLRGVHTIVTGASAGIGREVALALAERGAVVTASGRRESRLEALEAEARQRAAAGSVQWVPGDLTAVQVQNAVLDRCPAPAFAVLCAGVMKHALIAASDPADWQRVFDVNVMATLGIARRCALAMLQCGHGHIVIISSVLARSVEVTTAAYSASKAAQHALAQGLRAEFGGLGVRVTEILPGFTDTELRRCIDDPAALRRIAARTAVMTAADVAGAVLYALTAPPHVLVEEIVINPFPPPRPQASA